MKCHFCCCYLLLACYSKHFSVDSIFFPVPINVINIDRLKDDSGSCLRWLNLPLVLSDVHLKRDHAEILFNLIIFPHCLIKLIPRYTTTLNCLVSTHVLLGFEEKIMWILWLMGFKVRSRLCYIYVSCMMMCWYAPPIFCVLFCPLSQVLPRYFQGPATPSSTVCMCAYIINSVV